MLKFRLFSFFKSKPTERQKPFHMGRLILLTLYVCVILGFKRFAQTALNNLLWTTSRERGVRFLRVDGQHKDVTSNINEITINPE